MNITPQYLVELLKSNIIEQIRFIEERGFVQLDMGDSNAYWKRDTMYLNFGERCWRAKIGGEDWSWWKNTPQEAIEFLRESLSRQIKDKKERLNELKETAKKADEFAKVLAEKTEK